MRCVRGRWHCYRKLAHRLYKRACTTGEGKAVINRRDSADWASWTRHSRTRTVVHNEGGGAHTLKKQAEGVLTVKNDENMQGYEHWEGWMVASGDRPRNDGGPQSGLVECKIEIQVNFTCKCTHSRSARIFVWCKSAAMSFVYSAVSLVGVPSHRRLANSITT